MVIPTRDEQIALRDVTLHSVQWGTQGTPIVLLHGLTANAFCFQAFANALAPDYQVIAYDLRGRGDSSKPPTGYSVPIHAADLAQLIDTLQLQRPIIIGHSLGALIALYFAANYPEKLSKLVLIDAGGPLPWSTPEEQPAWLTLSIQRLGARVPSYEDYVSRLKLAPFLGPYWNEFTDIYIQHDVHRFADGSVAAKASRDAILEEGLNYPLAAPEQQWAHVQVPTLLLRAGQGLFSDNDQLLPEQTAAAIEQHIAHCHSINYPTLNHYTIILAVEPGPIQDIQRFLQASITEEK